MVSFASIAAKIIALLPSRQRVDCTSCPMLAQINEKLLRLEKSEAFIIRKLNYLASRIELVEVVSLDETDVKESPSVRLSNGPKISL